MKSKSKSPKVDSPEKWLAPISDDPRPLWEALEDYMAEHPEMTQREYESILFREKKRRYKPIDMAL